MKTTQLTYRAARVYVRRRKRELWAEVADRWPDRANICLLWTGARKPEDIPGPLFKRCLELIRNDKADLGADLLFILDVTGLTPDQVYERRRINAIRTARAMFLDRRQRALLDTLDTTGPHRERLLYYNDHYMRMEQLDTWIAAAIGVARAPADDPLAALTSAQITRLEALTDLVRVQRLDPLVIFGPPPAPVGRVCGADWLALQKDMERWASIEAWGDALGCTDDWRVEQGLLGPQAERAALWCGLFDSEKARPSELVPDDYVAPLFSP